MTLAKVALADCCEIVSGATPDTSSTAYWGGDIFWATPKDLSNLDGHYISSTPRKLTVAGLSSCAAAVLPPNSVLFSSRAPIGHVAINTVPMATNQGFKSFVPNADRLDSKFLFHWLRAHRPFLESLGNGATFKEVSKATVSRVEIPLPGLHAQRRIAAILDQADALRAKRREALTELEKLTRATFVDMFGNPEVNSKALPKVPIGSFANVSTGGTPSRSNSTFFGGSVHWVKTTEVVGEAIYETEEGLTEAGLRAIRGKLHPARSIIIAMYGQGQTRGRCGLLMMPASCNQACGVVHPNESFDSDFLFWQLRFSYERLRALGRGGNQENLNLQLVSNFEVLMPRLEDQRAFTKRVHALQDVRRLAGRVGTLNGLPLLLPPAPRLPRRALTAPLFYFPPRT